MTKKEQKRQDRLMVLEAKITIYNALVPEIKGWVVKYHKALGEIWKTQINGNDKAVLVKHGLGYEISHYPSVSGFAWDNGLKELNNRLRLKA